MKREELCRAQVLVHRYGSAEEVKLFGQIMANDTEQRAEIERLTHELNQANEACAALREGKPLGPIIGAQTILNQAKEIEQKQTLIDSLILAAQSHAQLATAKGEVKP